MRSLFLILVASGTLFAQTDPVGSAIAAMQSGDLASAERLLQAQLKSQPKDAAALTVLGVVLDEEKKYDQAENAYKRALAVDSTDPSLLNNFGNHLLAGGHVDDARQMFSRTVSLDRTNKNANVQLAKLEVDRKRGSQALTYLAHLSDADRQTPDIDLLFGIALSSVRRYTEAEEHFRRVATARPDDFQAQYDLGLAASRANHNEQAETVLQHALALQPRNPDVLYDLAVVNLRQEKGIEAIALLARGSAIAPGRAEIQQLLAQSTAKLGYFEDSLKAWDELLAIRPQDDTARRERAFAATAIGKDADSALENLSAFTKRHPNDAIGHYELGTALSASESGRAAEELTKAIHLNPNLTAAYVARGLLFYRKGNTGAALSDFQAASKQQPANARILDRLGEADLASGHTDNALTALNQAATIAPQDPSILLHLGRALTKAGQTAAAVDVFARYRKLDVSSADSSHGSGLVEFLSLPSGEQQARYRAGVERTMKAEPENVAAKVKYLELLLGDGNPSQVRQLCQDIIALKPGSDLAAEAGRALLDAEQYPQAEEFLEKVIAASGSLPVLQRELAQARSSFYSARAEMVQALGRSGSPQ